MKVLITGITGLIGNLLAKKLLNGNYDLIGLIRPGTDKKRLGDVQDNNKLELIEVDLADNFTLKEKIKKIEFDAVLHIGAIRGGRKFPRETYYLANVAATDILMDRANELNAKFVFCSSVGVFGAIPKTVPANNSSEKQKDNYYHLTKILSEKMLKKQVEEGLRGIIVRPTITYGIGDYGFPYTLIKMIDKKIMFLPTQDIKLHLGDVETITNIFIEVLKKNIEPGKEYIAADSKPISLYKLTNFIYSNLKGRETKYPQKMPTSLFRIGEFFSKKINSELWTARFQLISKNWYYDVSNTYKDLELTTSKTLPQFKRIIEWYKEQ